MADETQMTSEQIAGLLRSLKELSDTMKGVKKEDVPATAEALQQQAEQQQLPPGSGIVAAYANSFHIWADQETVRFVFGDSVGGEPTRFMGAYVMPKALAHDLLRILGELLAKKDEAVKK